MLRIPFFTARPRAPTPVVSASALDKFLTPATKDSFWDHAPNFDYTTDENIVTVTHFWQTPYFSLAEWRGDCSEEGDRGELRSVQLKGLLNLSNKPGRTVRVTHDAFMSAPAEVKALLMRVQRTRLLPLPAPLGEDYGSIFVGELEIGGLENKPRMTIADMPDGTFFAKGVYFYPLH